MPIGFSDLLKTTAQLDNNLTKGIVSTDDTYGGVRSKIDDWTDLHLSTYNGGSAYTFQDDGTSAAPGHFKEYSTMFYVADGRALVQNDSASGDYITLNPATGAYDADGTKFEVPAGTAEPEFWVLDDATQVGGEGSGTDKLPLFTIAGTAGSYTATPAGYQKLQVLTNAASADGAVSLATDVDNNLLSVSSGELDLDTQAANKVFAGPDTGSDAVPAFRSLVAADLPTDVVYDSDIQSALFDGDFGSSGIMATNGSGSYSIVSDNSSNWDTAYGWGDHGSVGYLLSETSHSDVLVDGDFGSAGIMATNGSGGYSIVSDNSSNWDTAYGWGDHGSVGYLLSETSHADVLVDGDFGSAGIMATDGSGGYSIVSNNSSNWDTAYGWGDHGSVGYLLSETSHADVLVDGDFGTAGIMATNGSGTYSIVSDNSSNWNTAHGWGNHADAGYVSTSHTGNVSITGNLTVSGDFIQANSTAVNFEDNVLQLAVPRGSDDAITAEDGTSAQDSGLDFVKVTSVGSIDEFASMRYDVSADKIKFTRHADGGDFSAGNIISGADNVATLKFTKTDTNTQVDQANGTTTMNAAHEANAEAVRSLGAVSKCSIEITTDAGDVGDNYAPAEAGAVGYPIKHNLDTQSVFVVAIKTHNDAGSLLADPVPVYCKYIPEDDNTIRVSVGVTKRLEKYDIIVIG